MTKTDFYSRLVDYCTLRKHGHTLDILKDAMPQLRPDLIEMPADWLQCTYDSITRLAPALSGETDIALRVYADIEIEERYIVTDRLRDLFATI